MTEITRQAEDILNTEDYKRIVENLLFITDRPLPPAKISQVAEINNIELTRDIIAILQTEYTQSARAIQIIEVGGGFQMSTKPEYGRWVRKLFNEKMSVKLSPAALETLAIIAYKQPITRAEIEVIRGVDIVGPLEKLMERGLVKIVGKRDAPGKPMLYATTEEFLRIFGLNNITELPDLKEFSAKGPRQMQGDLPFSESLPDIKNAILPLDDEEEDFIEVLPNTFTPVAKPKEDIIVPAQNPEAAAQDGNEEKTDFIHTNTPETENESPAADEDKANNQQGQDTAKEDTPQQEAKDTAVSTEANSTEEEESGFASAEPRDENLPENMQIDDIKDLNP